ncbi:MAG: tRNA pseudouridine(13) synthase TruD [Thermoproteota archaeon]|nr:tRNA pseudouridine(13) synthase TruD [Thermoproteota archaeon]
MIPEIDSELGLNVYSTKFSGTNGKIKQNNKDFEVSEVISEKALDTISEETGFAIYNLRKNGIDTNHALRDVEKRFGLVLRALGLKDSHAITEQFVQAKTISRSLEKIDGKKYSLKRIGFSKKPIAKQDMLGNKFKIKISDSTKDISQFNEHDKILNFFGYQRFGSKRPITHLVGKAIIQNDYQKAIDFLLNYSSKYDSEENNQYRKLIAERKSELEIIDQLPRSMDIETAVLRSLAKSNDQKTAIREIPLQMRRFYVQAYQSYIFNKTLSMAFEYEEELFHPKESDVCYDRTSQLGKFQNEPDQRLTVPLVGHSYFKKTRFDYYIQKILETEEVSPSEFLIKDFQEISVEGGFRNSSIQCDNFQTSNDIIEFQLSRGSYATIVIREILKPGDPLSCGF